MPGTFACTPWPAGRRSTQSGSITQKYVVQILIFANCGVLRVETQKIADLIRADVPRDVLIDLADAARASRKLAGEHALGMGLAGKSANRIAGMAAHELMELRLCELTEAAGGLVLEGGCFPGTTLRSYQSLCRYGRVLIGKASISEIGALPNPNMTRANGAKLNVPYGSQTYLEGLEPQAPTEDVVYMLLLTCRDRNDVKSLAEVAIGVLEPDCSGFVMYQKVDRFLGSYDAAPVVRDPSGDRPRSATPAGLSLKPIAAPFVGGETEPEDADDSGRTG